MCSIKFPLNQIVVFVFVLSGLFSVKTVHAQQQDINSLLDNFIYYTELGEFEQALPYARKAYLQAKRYQSGNQMYYVLVSILAKAYRNVDELDSAQKYMHKTQRTVFRQFGEFSVENGETLNLIGSIYHDQLQLDSAEMAYKSAINVLENTLNSTEELISACNNLADLNQDRGQLNDAMYNYDRALTFCTTSSGKGHSYYPVILSNQATLYGDIGQTKRALVLMDEVIEIYKSRGDTSTFSFAQKLSNRSIYNYRLAYYWATKADVDRALKILTIPTPTQQLLIATLLNTRSQVSEAQGNLRDASTDLQHAMKIVAQIKGTQHPDYLEKANNMGLLFLQLGEPVKAEELLIESRIAAGKMYGEDSPLYTQLTRSLASVFAASAQIDKAIELKIEANRSLQNEFREILQFGTEQEKKKFVYDIYHILEVNQSFALHYPNVSEKLITSNANLLLSLNGAVLASSSRVLQELRKAESVDAKNLLDAYEKTYVLLNRAKEDELNWNKQDSLRVALTNIERRIARLYPNNSGQSITFINADQVRKALKKDEIAVVFSDFRYHDGVQWSDSTVYVAYLFSAKSNVPAFQFVCAESDIRQIQKQTSPEQLYAFRGAGAVETVGQAALQQLYSLLISPIKSYLSGVKKVHFVPAGLLHQIPFAALYHEQELELCHQFELDQYISLGAMLTKQSRQKITDVVLVGGVKFGLYSPVSGSTGGVSGWDFLPGTKEEVDEIAKSLGGEQLNVNVVEGYNATEQKLKVLMENCDIFHVVTHGFFFEEKRVLPGSSSGYSVFELAEDPLLRNGILLAKANKKWRKTDNALDSADGILTAAEISMKDLQKAQLVTLSACQTGLGDIDQSEGVYGLQRAFKMAGVSYIMASLWQVPDRETAQFMQTFYTQLLQNGDIREAFVATQRIMQRTYPEEPVKWAAFILTK